MDTYKNTLTEKIQKEMRLISDMFKKGTSRTLVLEYFQEYQHEMKLNAKYRRRLKNWIYRRYI
jgi:hypothetical protein